MPRWITLNRGVKPLVQIRFNQSGRASALAREKTIESGISGISGDQRSETDRVLR